MFFSANLQLFKVIHYVYCTLVSQLNCPPFYKVFTGVANIHSPPIVWEGGGQAGSHKVAGKGYVFTKNNQMAFIGTIFTSTCHTKQLNPSASCVVNYIRLFPCQGKRTECNQTDQLSAVLNTCAIGPLVQFSNGDEKCLETVHV